MESVQELTETAAMDLGALLDAGDGAVVTLVAGDSRLAAHRAVLLARSPVFAAMFTLEANRGEVTITDMEGPVLRQLLAFLYTLQIPPLPDMASRLLVAADKYGLSTLKAQCEQQVATQLSVETAAAAAVLAVRHACGSLRQAAIAFIRAHMVQVVGTQCWADAMRSQPEDLIEVSRLLSDTHTESSTPDSGHSNTAPSSQLHSDHGLAPLTGAPLTVPHDIVEPSPTAVSRIWRLSEKEKGRRLIEAAKKGALEDLLTLLAAGADVRTRDGDLETALHRAARKGHVEVIRCLLENGSQIDSRNIKQSTPLQSAAEGGHTAVVRLLLASSADHTASNQYGKTALHYAAQQGHAGAVAALLEAGAHRGAICNNWNTPMDLARQGNHQQVICMLR